MRKPPDCYDKMVGKQYGKLTVLEIKRKNGKYSTAVCYCSCGNVVKVELSKLLLGIIKSCGCLRRDNDKRSDTLTGDCSETLCWRCVRSGNTCPWMNNFTPVKGWKATRYDYIVSYNKKMKNVKRTGKFYCVVDSYIVEECPLFLKRKKREEKLPSGQFTDSENRQ